MGYWENSNANLFTGCAFNTVLGRAIIDATAHGIGISKYASSAVEEALKNTVEEDNDEYDDDSFSLNLDMEDLGLDYYCFDDGCSPYTLCDFSVELCKAALAFFPNAGGQGNGGAEYSVGGVSAYAILLENGKIAFKDGTDSALFDGDSDIDGDADLDKDSDIDDDSDLVDAVTDLVSRNLRNHFNDYIQCEYPNYKLNWDGEGTYHVIKAAIECGQAESVRTVANKEMLSEEQLQGALDISIKENDAEVSATILEWLKVKSIEQKYLI